MTVQLELKYVAKSMISNKGRLRLPVKSGLLVDSAPWGSFLTGVNWAGPESEL
jgi:hypothetical protein